MSEIVRPRLSKEESEMQMNTVKNIESHVSEIKKLSESFKGKTCKTAFLNSVTNLEKKCELYGKEKVTLTDEEKAVIKEAQKKALSEFRAQKQIEVSSNEETRIDESIPEIPESVSEVKKGKKHGKN